MIVDYASLVNRINVISQDAYLVGIIEGVRYDPQDYSIEGLVVKCEKDVSNLIGAGTAKSRILIRPDSFEFRDVLLLGTTVDEERPNIKPDNEAKSSVDNLINKQVYTKDDKVLGTVKSVQLDLGGWYIHSFTIKLDKEAHAPLGLKKLLFAKEISGIMVDHVSTVSDSMVLTLTMDEVKGVMQTSE